MACATASLSLHCSPSAPSFLGRAARRRGVRLGHALVTPSAAAPRPRLRPSTSTRAASTGATRLQPATWLLQAAAGWAGPSQLDELVGLLVPREALLRARYASAMGPRVAWFMGQALYATSTFYEVDVGAVSGVVAAALLQDTSVEGGLRLLGLDVAPTRNARGDSLEEEERKQVGEFWRVNLTALVEVLQSDLRNIEAGIYPIPYDLRLSYAQQWDPRSVLDISSKYMQDQELVVERRRQGQASQARELLSQEDLAGRDYPAYYVRNFHYQSDGWLSMASAHLYDYQVETLFLGVADAMRRQGLVPLATAVKELQTHRKDSDGNPSIKLLDVASGTGRFLSFLLQAHPEIDATALDLSKFYLQKAKEQCREHTGKGGKLALVEANAEDMPFEDCSFELITNVYLFHELPTEAQRNTAREFGRVLMPGGTAVVIDSIQEGDVMFGERMLKAFPEFNHEPYYEAYTKTDLGELFKQAAGLELVETSTHWLTKVMVFKKPEDPSRTPSAGDVDVCNDTNMASTA